MRINTDFLIVTYIVGLFIDWVFQFDWQAINKSKWGKNDNKSLSFMALLSHSVIYGSLTSIIVQYIVGLTPRQYGVITFVLILSHIIIDTRIPVKWIMKYVKQMKQEQIDDTLNYGFMHIGIDHRLHELVILILSIVIMYIK